MQAVCADTFQGGTSVSYDRDIYLRQFRIKYPITLIAGYRGAMVPGTMSKEYLEATLHSEAFERPAGDHKSWRSAAISAKTMRHILTVRLGHRTRRS